MDRSRDIANDSFAEILATSSSTSNPSGPSPGSNLKNEGIILSKQTQEKSVVQKHTKWNVTNYQVCCVPSGEGIPLK